MGWLGWLGAGLVGLALGLLGSGGSILTVPILVYLLGQQDKVAIAGSLAVVGAIALVGGLRAATRRRVSWRSVLLFGLPGIAGTALGAWLAHYVSGAFQLVVFALFMLVASAMMLRPRATTKDLPVAAPRRRPWRTASEGFAVGLGTGFVGIGGGFMIVPALVLVGGLPMHLAVGTSLWIISINAFTGFARYQPSLAAHGQALDWPVLARFVAAGAAGSLAGGRLGAAVPERLLRRIFGVALVALGIFVLVKNLSRLFG